MSTFSGLTNALRSLNAQQYGLSVTSDNMANANTKGYTRKSADLQSVGVVGGVSRVYATTNDYTGTVRADSASRLNDPVLDNRARVEQGLNSYATAKAGTLSDVETVFNEPSDSGLGEQLNTFWAKWSNLGNSTDPSNSSLRNDVMQAGATVAATLNAASTTLSNQLTSATSGLSQTVATINSTATQVASLNAQIKVGIASGEDVNTLSDQRDALLVTLANLSGATSSIDATGAATVNLPGTTPGSTVSLVSGTTSSPVAVAGTAPSLSITVGGTAIGATTGTLQGQLDAVTTVIPGYQSSLDAVAASLASAVNAGQAAGYDYETPPVAGTPFFGPPTPATITAANITVAISDGTKIAASATATGALPDKDGSNAAATAKLANAAGGADSLYRTMIDTLGAASQAATQASTVQSAVSTSVNNLQQSASGVNYDEETNNILIFQRAYQASSRVLTTVDDMLDQLINHTGRVGI
jgi:flagellar hook-associated protein 1 FlgK